MGSLLMYRDLPGGPTEIRLADEIPRHCLCGRCGMLTLSMYQDPKDHMFCETCLKEQSTEQRSSIYCPYERKDVGIEEMFQARDLVMILRDQYADCPNQPDCNEKVPLENLHDHYVSCKPRVQCSRCHESIETKQWRNHTCTSVMQGSVPTKERTGASKKTLKDGGHQKKEEPSVFSSQEPKECKQSLVEKVCRALAASTAPSRGALGRTTAASQPDRQAASAMRNTAAPMQDIGSENCGPAATQECQYCHRKVKETNMQRHVQNCTRAPRPCVYCDEPFLPEEMTSHFEVCGRNPDNVKEWKPEAAAAGATSGTPDTNCAGPAGFHTDSGNNFGDLPIWLQYLAPGNWLKAYVAMEESLRRSSLQDTDRYAVFAPAFVRLDQRAFVEDFLGEPCPVQPLDCLMAALFVRAYLPRDVLSRREPVTWERALQYLPHFLASRLSEEALAYLCAYPVFLDKNGSQCRTECTSAASAQPCLNPELSSTSEETPSSRTSGGAHEGTRTEPRTSNASLEEKAAPSPASGKEYSSVASESSSILPWLSSYLPKYPKEPTPSGALFQESTRKPDVQLKRDDSPRNEDADKTVYLDVPPGPRNSHQDHRPRNSPDGIADTHTLRKQDMLFAAIQGLPRQQHDHLRNAHVCSTLAQVNATPVPMNTAADSCQRIEELQAALSSMSVATSSTESTPAGGAADLKPERAGRRSNYNKEKIFPPITCREFVDCQENESRISCTSYTERECYKDRYHGLSVQAPCSTFRTPGNAPEQYHRTESSNMSLADRFVWQYGRSRGVPPLQHSPAPNEYSSSLHLVRSRGRGFQMPNNDPSRTRYINGETSREAVRAHLECNENFENAERELSL